MAYSVYINGHIRRRPLLQWDDWDEWLLLINYKLTIVVSKR